VGPDLAGRRGGTDAPGAAVALSLGDVIRLASERRDEIQAARARTRAGEARPAIVSALQAPNDFVLA